MNNQFRNISFVLFVLVLFSALCPPASSQTRISDSDLEKLLQNLKEDAKSFRPVFESSLKQSSIRKTSQEKDARQLAERFSKETERAWKQFKKTRNNNVGISEVSGTAQQIDKLVNGLSLNGATSTAWTKIRQELGQVEVAFGLPKSTLLPATSTPATSSSSCRLAVGDERAKRLVEECSQVSTAMHTPCNAENSCVLIIDEIKRGCAVLGRDAPQYCLEYK